MNRRIVSRRKCEQAILQVSRCPFASQMLNGIDRREPPQLLSQFGTDHADPSAGLKQGRDLTPCNLAPADHHAPATREIHGYRQVAHQTKKFYYSDWR